MPAIDWYKATLEFLKGNKILMFLVVSLFGGNVYQARTQIEAPKEIAKEAPIAKPSGCECMKEINKLKRWHQ